MRGPSKNASASPDAPKSPTLSTMYNSGGPPADAFATRSVGSRRPSSPMTGRGVREGSSYTWRLAGRPRRTINRSWVATTRRSLWAESAGARSSTPRAAPSADRVVTMQSEPITTSGVGEAEGLLRRACAHDDAFDVTDGCRDAHVAALAPRRSTAPTDHNVRIATGIICAPAVA
jgi:hypothetical protein